MFIMEFIKVKGYKEVSNYIRKVKCSLCGNFLLSVYARNKVSFFSVEGWYYCPICLKLFQLKEENPNSK